MTGPRRVETVDRLADVRLVEHAERVDGKQEAERSGEPKERDWVDEAGDVRREVVLKEGTDEVGLPEVVLGEVAYEDVRVEPATHRRLRRQ